MHIDILGIVEETIHLKSWKIPWVLFRKQEGENFNGSTDGEKDDFCSFSLALVFFWHGCQRMVFIFFFTPILSSISFRCVLSFPLLAWCYTYCPSWKIEAKGKGKENRPHFGLNGDKKKAEAIAGQKVTLCKKRICLLLFPTEHCIIFLPFYHH